MIILTLKAKLIPIGTIVTKKNGNKVYKLINKIPLFANKEQSQQIEVKIPDDSLMLMCEDGISLIGEETELSVHFQTINRFSIFVSDFIENNADIDEA